MPGLQYMFNKGPLNEGGNYCSDLNAQPKQVKRIPLRWIVECGDESWAKIAVPVMKNQHLIK